MRNFNSLPVIVIAVGVILAVIPYDSVTHVAKACSFGVQVSNAGRTGSESGTSSGSCSTAASVTQSEGFGTSVGGGQSSCSTSSSFSTSHSSSSSSSNNGAVSCSSHSP